MSVIILICCLAVAVVGNVEAKTITLSQLERMLRSEVDQCHGTRYLLGGMSKAGGDCSGFVKRALAICLE